jgi:triacylglycerol lipase
MHRVLAFVTVLAALAVAPAGALAAGEPLPPQGAPPPGTNDFSCKPPAKHPYPVVLVHGTFENMTESWNVLVPALKRLNYCVFALDYGNSPIPGVNGVGDIPTSARQLQTFVDEVLAKTGAAKVSLVGHSQGGMMPRYLIKNLGYGDKVDDLIGFSPSNHGTTNPLAPPAGGFGCPACAQQVQGSSFITALNAGDETPGSASYTSIATKNDEVVVPYTSAFLSPDDDTVTNITLQDKCPADPVEHVGTQGDPIAIQWALSALGRPGPADPNLAIDCSGQKAFTFPDSSSVGDGSSSATGGGGSGGGSGGAKPSTKRVKLHLSRSTTKAATRRLRVNIKVYNGKLTGLRLIVRSGGMKGKSVGRSKRIKLSGRTKVTILLKRPLAAGGYTITARGLDAAKRPVKAALIFTARELQASGPDPSTCMQVEGSGPMACTVTPARAPRSRAARRRGPSPRRSAGRPPSTAADR